MHRAGKDGALRYLDFALLDILCMQFSLIMAYWLTGHSGLIYLETDYRIQACIFFSAQMALGLFSDCYDGILNRGPYAEFWVLLRYVAEVWLLGGVFILMTGLDVSFIQLVMASIFYFDIDFFLRRSNKSRHYNKGIDQRRIVLVTSSALARKVVERFRKSKMANLHVITGIVLLDDIDREQFADLGIPVLCAGDDNIFDELSHWWIDDALYLASEKDVYPKNLMESFLVMGVTIHYSLSILDEFAFAKADVQDMGDYKVISNSIHFVTDRSLLFKRILDILGGLVGTIATGILFIFVAPAIYIKSPGPIFFAQERVGLNGRIFRLYKFRSMYMDAEKRKAELMAKNKIQDGLMFKMEDDPRIIGSEKKGKDGKPKGIGNFIRNTSIDEFPQFFNVLKGDMSLVGTRPPTLDEWKKYSPHHRVRMSAKPGITGMWQVSGRSSITDFEKVVELDRTYIENWSLGLDIKILIRTVKVVLKHEGAS